MTLKIVDFREALELVSFNDFINTYVNESFETKIPPKYGMNMPDFDDKVIDRSGKTCFKATKDLVIMVGVTREDDIGWGEIGFSSFSNNDVDSMDKSIKGQLKGSEASLLKQANFILGISFLINKREKYKVLFFKGASHTHVAFYEKLFNNKNFVNAVKKSGYEPVYKESQKTFLFKQI